MEFNMPYHKNPAVKKAWWDPQDGYFKWEIDRGAKKKALGRKFVQDLATLCRGGSIMALEDVPAFMLKHGPLWSGDRIKGGRVASSLWTFAQIAALVTGLRQPGVPSAQTGERADAYLSTPLTQWEDWVQGESAKAFSSPLDEWLHEWNNEPPTGEGVAARKGYALYRLPLPVPSSNAFVPVEDTPKFWPRFRLPKEPLDTWEKRNDWFFRELRRNVCELLRKGMEFYPVIVKDQEGGMGHAVLHVRCKDAFTFAIGYLVFEWRPLPCPQCGKPAIGSTCGSPRCRKANLTTAAKQRVLDHLHHQIRYGKLTEGQYDFCKRKAREFFWEDETEDPCKLMQKVVASMEEHWPDKDFSFILKGFGSRPGRSRKKTRTPGRNDGARV